MSYGTAQAESSWPRSGGLATAANFSSSGRGVMAGRWLATEVCGARQSAATPRAAVAMFSFSATAPPPPERGHSCPFGWFRTATKRTGMPALLQRFLVMAFLPNTIGGLVSLLFPNPVRADVRRSPRLPSGPRGHVVGAPNSKSARTRGSGSISTRRTGVRRSDDVDRLSLPSLPSLPTSAATALRAPARLVGHRTAAVATTWSVTGPSRPDS